MLSQFDPSITLEQLRYQHEGHYFDRKSARISSKKLMEVLSSFSNADGGLIVVGIENDGEISGLEMDESAANRCHQAAREYLETVPLYELEIVSVMSDEKGILTLCLFHVPPSHDRIIKLKNNDVFIRQGNHTIQLKAPEILRLEYSRGIRRFEEEVVEDASIDDFDKDLLAEYRSLFNTETLSIEDLLVARGVLKRKDKQLRVTNAGIILFSKIPTQFLPSARVRFIRYDGIQAEVGTSINIIKDITMEKPLHRLISEMKTLISAQMREFQTLDKSGRFISVSEYPEFAWLEGLVNAVAHRDYSIAGDHIRISMFDDRIEFLSPGKLPNIITIENIAYTRYARNPVICRVLTDFGWVRELNEGVKRIYLDMEKLFLEPPLFSEPSGCLKLVLKNNIAVRSLRKMAGILTSGNIQKLEKLSPLEWMILTIISNKEKCSIANLISATNSSRYIIVRRLKKLIDCGFIHEYASSSLDPNKYYDIVRRSNNP